MKLLVAAIFCLFTLTAHAQASWPRNPTTGKVEFRGWLPWPASVKTEAQRRALVRRWYLAKLTDETAAAVGTRAKTVVSPTLLTYANLPVVSALRYGFGESAILLGYEINLLPGGKGLACTVSGFDWTTEREAGAAGAPLALKIVSPTPDEQAALAALRKRLAGAVAGW